MTENRLRLKNKATIFALAGVAFMLMLAFEKTYEGEYVHLQI